MYLLVVAMVVVFLAVVPCKAIEVPENAPCLNAELVKSADNGFCDDKACYVVIYNGMSAQYPYHEAMVWKEYIECGRFITIPHPVFVVYGHSKADVVRQANTLLRVIGLW